MQEVYHINGALGFSCIACFPNSGQGLQAVLVVEVVLFLNDVMLLLRLSLCVKGVRGLQCLNDVQRVLGTLLCYFPNAAIFMSCQKALYGQEACKICPHESTCHMARDKSVTSKVSLSELSKLSCRRICILKGLAEQGLMQAYWLVAVGPKL